MSNLKQEQNKLNSHLKAINDIFDEVASYQADVSQRLDKKATYVLKVKKRALEALREAQEKRQAADDRLNEIDRRYEAADKLAVFFEEVAEKERGEVQEMLGKIRRTKEDNKAILVDIRNERERLKEKERQLEDKQMALDRSWAELQRKKLALGL